MYAKVLEKDLVKSIGCLEGNLLLGNQIILSLSVNLDALTMSALVS